MWNKISVFLKDSIIKYTVLAAMVLIIAQIITVVLGIKPAEEAISLHYTTYLGVDFLGAWYLVYLIPIASFLFLVLNGIFAFYLIHREKLLSYLLMIGAVLAAVFLLIQAVLLVMLNS